MESKTWEVSSFVSYRSNPVSGAVLQLSSKTAPPNRAGCTLEIRLFPSVFHNRGVFGWHRTIPPFLTFTTNGADFGGRFHCDYYHRVYYDHCTTAAQRKLTPKVTLCTTERTHLSCLYGALPREHNLTSLLIPIVLFICVCDQHG